jgi:hypothetical protein
MGGDEERAGAPVLDYATPQPPRAGLLQRLVRWLLGLPRRAWRRVRDAGPWSIRLSWRCLPFIAAIALSYLWLRATCFPWSPIARVDDRLFAGDTFRLVPGGRAVVAIDGDGSVDLIDLQDPAASMPLRTPPGFGGFDRVWCTDDGRNAVADNGVGFAKWDLRSGQLVSSAAKLGNRNRPGVGGPNGAALAPRGDRLAIIDDTGAFELWDISTATPVRRARRELLAVMQASSTALEFSPDGRYALVRFLNITFVVEAESGRRFASASDVDVIRFSSQKPGVALVAVGSKFDWRPMTDLSHPAKPILTPHLIQSMAVSPDGRRIAIGGEGMISVWDADTRIQVSEWPAPAWNVPAYVPWSLRARALCWVGNDRVASRDELPDELAIHRASDGMQVARVPTRLRRGGRPVETAFSHGSMLLLADRTLTAWVPVHGESVAGMFARPAWWAVFITSWAFTLIVRRDNARGRDNARPAARRCVEVVLCVAGAYCIASFLAWHAMGGWTSFGLRAWRQDHVGYWLGLAALLCAVDSAGGGRGWGALMSGTLVVAAGLAAVAALMAPREPTYFYLLDTKFPIGGAVRSAVWGVAAGACVFGVWALREDRDAI